MLFGLGDVLVHPVGSTLRLTAIRRPRDLADTILAAVEQVDKEPAAEDRRPAVSSTMHPALRESLSQLAAPRAAPPLPEPRLPSRMSTLIHRKIPVHLIDGETVLEVIYRHWIVLVRNELVPLVLGGVAYAIGWFMHLVSPTAPEWRDVWIAGAVVASLVAIFVYLNWADDVFIVTSHRVIDIDRIAFIFAEYGNDAPFNRIQDLHVERNALGHLFDFGSIAVETAGRQFPVRMRDIPHAFAVNNRIFAQVQRVREQEATRALNEQRQEQHRWMATVLTQLVVRVPDVRGLPFVSATTKLRAAGFKSVVGREQQNTAAVAGTVLAQSPAAGTSALSHSEVRLDLATHTSRRTPFATGARLPQ